MVAETNDPTKDVSTDAWNDDHDFTLAPSDVGAEPAGTVSTHETNVHTFTAFWKWGID